MTVDFNAKTVEIRIASCTFIILMYIKGREPWEYEDYELMVLCNACHASEHDEIDLLTDKLNSIKLDSNFSFTSNMEIAGMLEAYSHDGPFSIMIYDYHFASGVGIILRKSAEEVIAECDGDGLLPEGKIREWKAAVIESDKASQRRVD